VISLATALSDRKVVGDASLTSVPAHLRAEVVSPVLGYDDISQLHEVVRAIENSEFRFIPQERKGTLPEGVNV